MSDVSKRMLACIESGKEYLLSKTVDGLCLEFHQLRHGPSEAWVTACVGSSLAEFDSVPKRMVEAILSLRHGNGGWSYNSNVPSDADTTLRVMQFLRKIGSGYGAVAVMAEYFVLRHQLSDGGFTTYLPEIAEAMGYGGCTGWCSSHPCVTALAVNQISDVASVQRAKKYLQQNGSEAYWWRTPYYVQYEMGHSGDGVKAEDSIEISLSLLLNSKLSIYDPTAVEKLISLQREDGSMSPSQQFRIPRPHQTISDIRGDEEVVEDGLGILSTCVAIVAIERQRHLV